MSITATELKNNLGIGNGGYSDYKEREGCGKISESPSESGRYSKIVIWNFAKRCRYRGSKGRKVE